MLDSVVFSWFLVPGTVWRWTRRIFEFWKYFKWMKWIEIKKRRRKHPPLNRKIKTHKMLQKKNVWWVNINFIIAARKYFVNFCENSPNDQTVVFIPYYCINVLLCVVDFQVICCLIYLIIFINTKYFARFFFQQKNTRRLIAKIPWQKYANCAVNVLAMIICPF